jgi:hypothetical protein
MNTIRGRLMGGILMTMGAGVITTLSEEVKRPEVPALRLPADGSASPSPFPGFSWDEHPAAFHDPGKPVEYEIQIASDAAFTALVDVDRVALNRYVHDARLGPGRYHWRVRAIPHRGEATHWSVPFDFVVKEPDLLVTVDVSGDPVQGVRAAVAKAKAAGGQSVRIVMPPGEYSIAKLFRGYLFDLSGCSDVVVDGTGVTLNFASRQQGLIRARGCDGIAVTGFDVSFAKGCLRVQGKVTALDPATGKVTVKVEPGFPGFDASDNQRHDIIYLLEPGSEGRLKSGVRNFFRPEGDFINEGEDVWSFVIGKDFDRWGMGDRFACNFRSGSLHLVDFSESRGLTAHGLTTAGWGGMQYVSIEGNDFRILNCKSRFDEGKWMTGNADGVHIRGHRLGPWIEGMSIQAIGDDSIALYARPAWMKSVVAGEDSRKAICRTEFFNLEEGDEVSFFQPMTGAILLETTVESVKPVKGGFETSFADPVSEDIRFKGPVQQATQIWNRSKSCGDFMVRGCEFTNIRRYGTVFRSKRGVVENNSYRGISARAIVFINGTAWPNGLYASEIIVRNNSITDSCFDHPSGPAAISFVFNGYRRAAGCIGPRNILIEGNTIEDCPSPEIFLSWVRDAVVRDNVVRSGGDTAPASLEAKNSEEILHAKTRP